MEATDYSRRKRNNRRHSRVKRKALLHDASEQAANGNEAVVKKPLKGMNKLVYGDDDGPFRRCVAFCLVVACLGFVCMCISAYMYGTRITTTISATSCDASERIPNAHTPIGWCPFIWAKDAPGARGLLVVPPIPPNTNYTLLAVLRSEEKVYAMWDGDDDGTSDGTERVAIASAPGLNHGLAIDGEHLYASSSTTVFRWPYKGDRKPITAQPEVVITNMPEGGHVTRTLTFRAGFLYVAIGSGSNVDDNSNRARIMRFSPEQLEKVPMSWTDGELFADGTRNEVGMAVQPSTGAMWGVENGVDQLKRADLGGDIHIDNPAEELNLFEKAGAFYGYPYCWSVGSEGLLDHEPNTQFYHPKFAATYNDTWCQNTQNVVVPKFALQAHEAPLGMMFYSSIVNTTGLPMDEGDVIVALHGSWNREPPVGFSVERIAFDTTTHMPRGTHGTEVLFAHASETTAKWEHRPVNVQLYPCAKGVGECLLISSDASGVIIGLSYNPNTNDVYSLVSRTGVALITMLFGMLLCMLSCVCVCAFHYHRDRCFSCLNTRDEQEHKRQKQQQQQQQQQEEDGKDVVDVDDV